MNTGGPVSHWMAGQASSGSMLNSIFTPVISSLMLTEPSPLQSPMQVAGVEVGDAVRVVVGVKV
jgi:hypothetical protein